MDVNYNGASGLYYPSHKLNFVPQYSIIIVYQFPSDTVQCNFMLAYLKSIRSYFGNLIV